MEEAIESEKKEAQQFKQKFPGVQGAPKQSLLHRKRIQGGQKYFDSGDYNMNMAKSKPRVHPVNLVCVTPKDLPKPLRKPLLTSQSSLLLDSTSSVQQDGKAQPDEKPEEKMDEEK